MFTRRGLLGAIAGLGAAAIGYVTPKHKRVASGGGWSITTMTTPKGWIVVHDTLTQTYRVPYRNDPKNQSGLYFTKQTLWEHGGDLDKVIELFGYRLPGEPREVGTVDFKIRLIDVDKVREELRKAIAASDKAVIERLRQGFLERAEIAIIR